MVCQASQPLINEAKNQLIQGYCLVHPPKHTSLPIPLNIVGKLLLWTSESPTPPHDKLRNRTLSVHHMTLSSQRV